MEQNHRTPDRVEFWVKQVYTLFLRAYPPPFRQTFTAEMAEVFSDLVDEAAIRGTGSLLWLAGREFRQTTAAILSAYWFQRSRYWGQVKQMLKSFLSPEAPGSPDGRTSWRQTGLEAALFVILGVGQIITTYMADPAWKPIVNLLTVLILCTPLLWLIIGLARGMPRWAYPALGILLGYCFIASLATGAGLLFGILLLIALTLLGWAYRVNEKKPFLPGVFRAWRESPCTDITRLSFGGYGLLALVIVVAFDDAHANNHTAWLLVSVLCMLGGAAAYSRSRKQVTQLSCLTAGVTLSLLAALLDHARFAALQWPGPVWIFSLWCDLMILILLPPAAIRTLRFLQSRVWRAHASPRG